jgi:hypothetical protein
LPPTFSFFYYALLSRFAAHGALVLRAPRSPAATVQDHAAGVEVHDARFVVPFFFVLDPLGAGVLLQLPKGATGRGAR